ncbi:hypothetical protein J5N97_007764 [Dioscorea zingiberensis]|uniref:Peptidase A1 domain-containing protein n=1 Tax=Dioscorea zingiberensis TaxID=325984 RepID=A0A9D5DE60_9LILI|nr:hypothetical protein J5N97_007764 [Dioscorea zingiberensis]
MVFSDFVLVWVLLAFSVLHPHAASAKPFFFSIYNRSSAGIEIPTHLSFNSVAASSGSGCDHPLATNSAEKKDDRPGSDLEDDEDEEAIPQSEAMASQPLKLHLKHRSTRSTKSKTKRETLTESTHTDHFRIQTLYGRITEMKNQKGADKGRAGLEMKSAVAVPKELAGRLVATLESGVTLGSGEYFMDVFIGTPPRHFSLILDTGSDLNWIQCLPCHDCFDQHGPVYDPAASSSYRNVTCGDPRCGLVSSPDYPRRCPSPDHPCPYFYWYGDRSNTTGDLALESFTVNLTTTESRRVENVIFGCGHWNRGLFHGAAGLLGLGRGPLSFSSQLRSLYGHTFSYCLVDRNSDLSVSSKLIFGEDQSLITHPELNFTSFVPGRDNPADTFYYVQIKAITVGGEILNISKEAWELSKDGNGGTIIDSGTTLSYFTDPAYQAIKEAFLRKITNYAIIEGFPILNPCYNVSGVDKVDVPEFSIIFADGAVWNFPVENYFIRLEPEEMMCLAILGTPSSSLSILGNYQQQNFHIMYDTQRSRLGFAPMRCAEV